VPEKLTPGEELARQRAEEKVRAEYEAKHRQDAAEEIARAKLAISILLFLLVCGGVPLFGLVLGLAVRGFRWAAGY